MENNSQKNETYYEKLYRVKKELDNTKNQLQKTKEDVEKLNQEISYIKEEEVIERRKLENKLKRSIWEVFNISIGNKKKVEQLSKRVEDTKERFDKLDESITWVIRTLAALFITILIGGILRIAIGF